MLLPMNVHLRLSVDLPLDRMLIFLFLIAQFILKILRIIFLGFNGNWNVDWLEDENSFLNYSAFALFLSRHFIKLFFGDNFVFDCFFKGDLLRLMMPTGRLTECGVESRVRGMRWSSRTSHLMIESCRGLATLLLSC